MTNKTENNEHPIDYKTPADPYIDSEIVIGLVSAIGTDLNGIISILETNLLRFDYQDPITIDIADNILIDYLSQEETKKLPDDILMKYRPHEEEEIKKDYYLSTHKFMNIGNDLRKKDPKIIAAAVINWIANSRDTNTDGTYEPKKRKAYIIKSLKNKEEVKTLRDVYGNGFYMIGVYTDQERRKKRLIEKKFNSRYSTEEKEKCATQLMGRDEDENLGFGQQTRDTFQLADFFVDFENDSDKTELNIERIVDLLFGQPFITPTFGEYAMFQAFSTSLRSADLSRQIGAVICKNNEILATGANDCPAPGGGLYWYKYDKEKGIYEDGNGREYKKGHDSNKEQIKIISDEIINKAETSVKKAFEETDFQITLGLDPEIINEIIIKHFRNLLPNTQLNDLTEYGRIVHAEMEALAMCARNNISCRNATMYALTFPCHNCVKHLIAAGIKEVVYIEPYPKSKAFEFYGEDEITKNEKEAELSERMLFTPFFGVGPRKFVELFAMSSYGSFDEKKRKDKESETGKIVEWDRNENQNLRSQMVPTSYLEREKVYGSWYMKKKEEYESGNKEND